MKVLVVFGTRPEAIKLAPVIQELERRAEDARIRTVVCVTAQHRQMLDQVLELFEISPQYDLDLMGQNHTPTRIASTALAALEPILQCEKPDWVVVQGDTTTVAAVSLSAFYAQTRVAHVEAGLRTHDKWQPFPEEINRRIATAIADLHLAPTSRARQNLLQEGVPEQQIVITGNPVIDALHQAARKPNTIRFSGNLVKGPFLFLRWTKAFWCKFANIRRTADGRFRGERSQKVGNLLKKYW